MSDTHLDAANVIIDLVSTFEAGDSHETTELALRTATDALLAMGAVEVTPGAKEGHVTVDVTPMILAANTMVTYLADQLSRLRNTAEATVLFELREHLDRLRP
jgi:histidine ammonia-lyase